MVLSALIGAAGSLFGGRRQSRDNARAAVQERQIALADYEKQRGHALQDYQTQRADAAADQAAYWQNHRAASEAGGFNPLTTMGMTPQQGVPAIGQNVTAQTAVRPSSMGSAIAETGLFLADHFSRKKEANLQIEQLRLQNQKLTERLRDNTLRPHVGSWLSQPSAAVVAPSTVGEDNAGNIGADTDPISIMVAHKASDGSVHNAPNPDNADLDQGLYALGLDVTSRKVVWLFSEQLRPQFVPLLHRVQGRFAAQG